jgi:uncharacterized cupredoxin-like copper-binding protein
VTSRGDWFYAENQGDWVGSGHIAHVERGDFMGHPSSLVWSSLPGSLVKLRVADIPDTGEPMSVVAKRVPGIKQPAVWFPHTIMGQSVTEMREDLTGGKFGPFAGQFFVGDQNQSVVMRMSMEKVHGVWQGAAYSFRAGFESGVLRLAWGDDGSLLLGELSGGWGSVGGKEFAFERLVWTGRVPFEIKEIRAQPDGFLLTFTQPVDPMTAAKAASYSVVGFTYKYHSEYGSPAINRLDAPVRRVVVAPDRRSVRLVVACLREGYIHEVLAAGVRSATDRSALLHDVAYYTLNRLPGPRRKTLGDAGKACDPATAAAALRTSSRSPKHITRPPPDWPTPEGDRTIRITALSGLKFDSTLITVTAGSRVRLVLVNSDNMLHNWLLTLPGKGQKVGYAAMALGLDGADQNYAPDSPDVLSHTAVLQPNASETIYFVAPATPGDYDFICSFPGHFLQMRGILRVQAK